MTTHEWHDSWLRPTNVIGLMMGRAAFRLAGYGAGLILLAHWDRATFALYAGAIGAMGWLLTLVAGGIEKAAQTFLPRDDDRRLERFFVGAACAPYAVVMTLWTMSLAVDQSADVTRYLAAAALPCGVGGCSVLIALFRMRGRPVVDAVTYVHLSVGYAVAVLAVVAFDLGVNELFVVLLTWLLGAVVVLLARLRRVDLGSGASPAQRWEAVRAIPLLSMSELAGALSISTLYVLLAWGSDDDAVATFYVMSVVVSVIAMAWIYLLRLAQPSLVHRIVGGGVESLLSRGRRLARGTLLLGVVGTAGLGAALWLGAEGRGLLAGLVVCEATLFLGTSSIAFILENVDASGRRRVATTAVVELATVVAAGAALTPTSGAAGAFLALSLGLLAKVALLAVFVGQHAIQLPASDEAGTGSTTRS